MLHLALISDGKPYSVPVNFGYTVTEADGSKKLTLYFHGAGEGKKIESIKQNPNVSFCAETFADVDGDETACNWTCYYESVIGFKQYDNYSAERTKGMDAIMLHNGYKLPAGVKFIAYNAILLARTAVVKIEVDEITGKHHIKGK